MAPPSLILLFFFFNDTATTEIYTLSLHDALPISDIPHLHEPLVAQIRLDRRLRAVAVLERDDAVFLDRKSTRLNSSHSQISYAVFCLEKKKSYKLGGPRGGDITWHGVRVARPGSS